MGTGNGRSALEAAGILNDSAAGGLQPASRVRAIQRIRWVDEEGGGADFQRIVQVERLPAAGFPCALDDLHPGLTGTVVEVVRREGRLPVVNLAPITAGSLPAGRRQDPVATMAAGHWSPGHADVEDHADDRPEDAEPRS